jgi:hypothetical protein
VPEKSLQILIMFRPNGTESFLQEPFALLPRTSCRQQLAVLDKEE